MEPPKFKHKKAPRGPPSPPVPVLHSPPRKVAPTGSPPSQGVSLWLILPRLTPMNPLFRGSSGSITLILPRLTPMNPDPGCEFVVDSATVILYSRWHGRNLGLGRRG